MHSTISTVYPVLGLDARPSGTTKRGVDLDGDVQMNEATADSVRTRTPGTPSLSVATEDGEILEDGQISDTGGDSTPGPEKRESTPRPSSDQGDKRDRVLTSFSAVVQPSEAIDPLPPGVEHSRIASESSQYVRPSLKSAISFYFARVTILTYFSSVCGRPRRGQTSDLGSIGPWSET